MFNNYKNSNTILKKNNIFINHGLKLFTKDDEKTYDFPLLLNDKLYTNRNINNKNNETVNVINKERNKSLREKFMTKTIGNFYSHTKKTMNKRNLTLGDKLILFVILSSTESIGTVFLLFNSLSFSLKSNFIFLIFFLIS